MIKNKGAYLRNFLDGLRPEKTYTVTEWSDNFRFLAPNASAEPGKYRSSRTPFLIEIMDSLTANNEVEKVVFQKSAQIGGSEAGNNFIGYIMDVSPGSAMVVQPTTDTAKKFSKQRIDPMVEYSPTLKSKVASKRSKDASNTVLSKDFRGGMLNIVGANSAVGLRSTPVRFLFMDEIDAYPLDVDGEGDPVNLAEKRTTTFSRRKIFLNSTPTIENISTIAKEFKKGDQRYYNVPCPSCKGKQKLVFDQLKYKKKDDDSNTVIDDSVYYECIYCKSEIKEHHKTYMLAGGEWIPENTKADKKIRSYHINSLYSPLGWKTWKEVCNEWLDCQLDHFKRKTFINTVLGETYKEATQQPDWMKLYNRAESYGYFEAPKEVIWVNAGADTQDNRLACIMLGYGADNEIWVLAYEEILGSPKDPETWQRLRRFVDTPIKHPSGVMLSCNSCAIDSAGHNTDHVYDFVKKNNDKFHAVVGRGDIGFYIKVGKTIDIDMHGNKYSNPLNLYHVNTIQSKKTIYSFLQNDIQGPRFVHFSKDLPKDFYQMLTSEQLITKIIKGQQREEFIKPSSSTRNEALDCFCYAYAWAYSKGVSSMYGKEYDKLYSQIITAQIPKDKVTDDDDVVGMPRNKPSRLTNFNRHGVSFNRN